MSARELVSWVFFSWFAASYSGFFWWHRKRKVDESGWALIESAAPHIFVLTFPAGLIFTILLVVSIF